MKLYYRPDGTFKILHLTDLHWTTGTEDDRKTAAFTERAIRQEDPDFIALTGDVIDKLLAEYPAEALHAVLRPIVESGVPWALAFGNHEHEAKIDDQEVIAILASLPNSLCSREKTDYVLPVYGRQEDSIPKNLIYMLDSGAKTIEPFGGSAWFTKEQIEWYCYQSDRYAKLNDGKPIPSVAFFHIPLPEHRELWYFNPCYGNKNSGISSPKINTGMFAAMYLQRDVKAVFVGHNAMNDFYGFLYGICLGHTRTGGYSKGTFGVPRCARAILLDGSSGPWKTWQRMDDGSIAWSEKHLPQIQEEKKKDSETEGKTKFIKEIKPSGIIVDTADDGKLPKRFRMTGPAINTDTSNSWGLAQLNASGSGQFSRSGLRQIRAAVGSRPMVIIDLREECHGFVNGMAVSIYSKNNNANQGLSSDEIAVMEHALWRELSAMEHINFESFPPKSVDMPEPVKPVEVCSEKDLVLSEKMMYQRFYTTDHHRPSNDTVNAFIEFYRGCRGEWCHFHCRGGAGRTTTFMMMYDMLSNATKLSLEEIMQRHVSIGSKDLEALDTGNPFKYTLGVERLRFIKEFYQYCVNHKETNYAMPFSF